MRVLRTVASSGNNGCTLAEVVASSRLTKGTVHRLLSALTAEGLLGRNPDTKTYGLGQQLYALGILAAPRFGLHQLAIPSLRRLAAGSEDSAFLCLLSGHDVVCAHREEGSHPIRTHVMQAGLRYPLGVGSFGPAILAAMEDGEVERVLSVNRRAIEEYENYSIARVRQMIKTVRTRGYCLNPGLVFPESYGLAVAILDEDDQPVGALTIGAVASRMQPERQPKLAAMLRSESAAITRQLRAMRAKTAR
jgi:DNA-binding IclR family transcriptional regulator